MNHKILSTPVDEQMTAIREGVHAELDPELEEWLEDGPLGKSLKHPLVCEAILFSPGWANQTLARKKEALAQAEAEGDWHRVVFLHERPYRCWALIDYVVGRDEHDQPLSLDHFDSKTRDLATSVWTDSENIHQNLENWAAMFDLPPGFWLGNREAYDELPETLTVYRGDIDDGGYSWTLRRDVAHFFAQRFRKGRPARVLTGTVPKSEVFGYITSRNEQEILVRSADDVTLRKGKKNE